MSAAVPTQAEITGLAERAVALMEGEAQALVLWERRSGRRDALELVFTCVCAGRAGRATAAGTRDDELQRAAKAARLRARQARAWPSAGLPDPAPGRPHAGFDPAVLELAATPPAGVVGGAAKVAVASTRGVRIYEQRTWVVRDGAAAVRAVDAPLPALHATSDEPPAAPRGEPPVVLAPPAVAAVLDRLRPAFGVDLALGHGPLAGRLGTRVAAPVIQLSDAPHHPATLPRSFDAEGAPRREVALIEEGVARGGVHDTASAAACATATTGHATQPGTLAPMPENLVLAGGTEPDLHALCAPLDRGLYIGGLSIHDGALRTCGAIAIENGRPRRAVAPARVELDPLALLAAAEALTTGQHTVALPGHCPGGIGAATVPALRATAGLRLRG